MAGFFKRLFQSGGEDRSSRSREMGGNSSDSLLRELETVYNLRWEESWVGMIAASGSPYVWKGQVAAGVFSIRASKHEWELWVGEDDEIIDFELTAFSAAGSPANTPVWDHDGTPLPASLASRYAVTMTGHDEKEYLGPQLHDSAVENGLLRLSPSVHRLAFYHRSLEMNILRDRMTRASFDKDLAAASDIVRALQQRHRS